MKYNRSEIMKNAWKMFKENKANGLEFTFAMCLSTAWNMAKKAVKTVATKTTGTVKSIAGWFMNKNFSSSERYIISVADVVEITKETEKAILCKAHSDFGTFTFWAPKSVCVF